MTTKEFLVLFCESTGQPFEGIFQRGRKEGYLEAEDEIFCGDDITRKNVARILHMYLLKVRHVKDLDMKNAEVLRDLYDCRVCANHVAQMYLRGVMEARDLLSCGGFLWFDLNGVDTSLEVEDQITRALKIS